MKRILIIASLLATIVLSGAAQPEASWLERNYDFGVFKEENKEVNCEMRVLNTGNEPLLIVRAQAGCGCTSINYPEDPILPGDTASVKVTYNPSGRPGQFTKQVLIFTNTVPRRTILEISGNVIPTAATLDKQYSLRAGPLRISQRDMPMGELVKGKSGTQYLSAYNASTDTLLVSVQGAKPHIKPSIVPDTVPPARVTALTIHYLSGNAPLWGLNVDTLTMTCVPLNASSQVQPGSAEIHVMAQIIESFDHLTDKERSDAPTISADCGDRIDFGDMTPEQVVTRTFTITNKGKNPLIIRRLWTPQNEGISVEANRLEIKRGKQATVTVKVDTSMQQGEMLNVPLTIISNDPDTPRLTIRLVGIIDK